MTLKTPKKFLGVKKAAHARSPKQEAELAERLGGKIVKGSGCGFEKGDVRVRNKILLEAKCTSNKSFSITQEILDKIEDAACGNGELPVIEVEFLREGFPSRKICIAPHWVINELVKV